MPRINALPPNTEGIADDDKFALHNTSEGDTESGTFTQLKTWLQGLVGWITTAMLANGLLTTEKAADNAITLTKQAAEVYYANNTVVHDYRSLGAGRQTILDAAGAQFAVTIDVPAGNPDVLIEMDCLIDNDNTFGAGTYLQIDGVDSTNWGNLWRPGYAGDKSTHLTYIHENVPAGSHTYAFQDAASGTTSTKVEFYNRSIKAKVM